MASEDAGGKLAAENKVDPGSSAKPGLIATATVIVIAIVGLAWLMVKLSGFLLLVFAALVLAAIFNTMTRAISGKTGMKRGFALTLSVFALLAVFGSVFTLFGTQLANEFDTIRESIPAALDQVSNWLDQIGLGKPLHDAMGQGSQDLSKLLSQAGGYVLTLGNSIANLVLVFVGAIFIASDPGVYRRGVLLLIPSRAEDTAAAAIDDASHGLSGWMTGQAVSSLVVAVLTWGGLALLGVPASAGLGLIAGLLDIIPMVGPIISGVPAVLLAFTVSPMTALWTIGLFLVVQQLQGNFLQPMIQKHAVDVPPAVLLFSVVAAGLLFGFLGVLLAAPLTVVVFVLVQRIYVRALLGKDIKVAGRD